MRVRKEVRQEIESTPGLSIKVFNALPKKERKTIVKRIEANLAAKASKEASNYLKAIDANMGVQRPVAKTQTGPAIKAAVEESKGTLKAVISRLDDFVASCLEPTIIDEEAETEVIID